MRLSPLLHHYWNGSSDKHHLWKSIHHYLGKTENIKTAYLIMLNVKG